MGTPCTEGAIYKTRYDLFGKFSMEMTRAVRLVVDTGIHAFGWDLERSVQYMQTQTGKHRVECERECRRYASWPGQAVSYKVGYLCFRRLRDYAERELGSRFDVRWFHSQCLDNGPMPLDLLDEHIKAAVADRKRGAEV